MHWLAASSISTSPTVLERSITSGKNLTNIAENARASCSLLRFLPSLEYDRFFTLLLLSSLAFKYRIQYHQTVAAAGTRRCPITPFGHCRFESWLGGMNSSPSLVGMRKSKKHGEFQYNI
jgi:hypothetical protein